MKRSWTMALAVALAIVGIGAGYRWGPTVTEAARHLAFSAATAQAQQPEESAPTPTATAQAKSDRAAPNKPKAAGTRPWLGVQVSDVDGGAKVDAVVPGSPAEKAGLQGGDTITSVDGQAVGSAKQLVEVVSKHKAGDQITLAAKRNDTTLNVTAVLGTPPTRPAAPKPAPKLPNPLGPLGSLLPEWRDLPADQLLGHITGGSFSFTDKNGQQVTVEVAAGKVTSVAADAITIRANGESADRTYQISDQTRVFPGKGHRLTETVLKDDAVLVVSRRAGDKATALAIHDQTALQQGRGLPQPSSKGDGLGKPPGNRFHFRFPGHPGGPFGGQAPN